MRKAINCLISAVLVLAGITSVAQASQTPSIGKSCEKPQQNIKVGNQSLTCTAISSTIAVWKAKVVNSSTSPVVPTSFQDLDLHLNGIINGAWLKASHQVNNSSPSLGNVKLSVGPNTKEDDKNSVASLKLISQLYSQFSQVKNLYLIKYSQKDLGWARQQYDALKPSGYSPTYFDHQCLPPSGCDGGVAGVTSNGDGVIFLGQAGNYEGQPTIQGKNRASSGQVVAHEYTHTIQVLNSMSPGVGTSQGNLPQWLLEGNAEWSATVARFNSSYTDYLTFRSGDLKGQYSQPSLYTPQWLNTYLNPNPSFVSGKDNWSYWRSYPQWDLYAIGYLVNEILVDIKGPDSILNLYKDVGSGQTFQEAFQKEFGIAWSEACPVIAKTISDEIQKNIKS